MSMYFLPYISFYIKAHMCCKTSVLPMPLEKATHTKKKRAKQIGLLHKDSRQKKSGDL